MCPLSPAKETRTLWVWINKVHDDRQFSSWESFLGGHKWARIHAQAVCCSIACSSNTGCGVPIFHHTFSVKIVVPVKVGRTHIPKAIKTVIIFPIWSRLSLGSAMQFLCTIDHRYGPSLPFKWDGGDVMTWIHKEVKGWGYLDAAVIPGARTSMLMLYIMLGWTSIVAVYGPMSEAVP